MKAKRMNRGVIAALIVCMLLTLLPTTAFAATSSIGELDFTASTAPGTPSGVTWNATSKTLTLSNVTLNHDGNGEGALILPDGATIKVVGTCQVNGADVTSKSGVPGFGILAEGDLTIDVPKNASLTVTGGSNTHTSASKEGAYAIFAEGDLEIVVDDGENLPQTLNGWVMMMLEAIPDVGATFTHAHLHVEVIEISEKRVEKVRVTLLEKAEDDEEEK
jgi:hypothetical protein